MICRSVRERWRLCRIGSVIFGHQEQLAGPMSIILSDSRNKRNGIGIGIGSCAFDSA